MSDWDTETCEECNWSGNRIDPVTDLEIYKEGQNGEMLCSSCRVRKGLKNGWYQDE